MVADVWASVLVEVLQAAYQTGKRAIDSTPYGNGARYFCRGYFLDATKKATDISVTHILAKKHPERSKVKARRTLDIACHKERPSAWKRRPQIK